MSETIFKILLVEDDEALRFIVKDNLEQKNYNVEVAEDGKVALELFEHNYFDLIILDVMLPKIDGFQVAETIRKINEQVPIIFLTARSMTEDKITGLTIGGDDYIPKPFSMEELLLKIKIFLKRSQSQPVTKEISNKTLDIGKFRFQPEELTLAIDGDSRNLTLKEAELINIFSENINKVLSRNEILEKVWGSNDYFLGRSLDVFITRLRKYFKQDPNIKIVNLHGIGFRFSVKKDN
ncbi:MAG: response regulator transcription factor [Prolixibacteraceae bacterium]|jgi:DNA-binding response OmpR family regulator|nr:response regulator transcription factor [Prolixibacteraceae bacterium]MBT6005343.1 response regulator transcription factor [Prolixibacteraceae bacterium]MBT6764681.1 response regulator transcription factor [Prolixibacteraceae bacterium]MBT7000829.1 response regulator transcription factor [Prolixibacteraceae bacterium]MBT7395827.1 response regulator transcription factor [Prolixibacteraceae bacterium]